MDLNTVVLLFGFSETFGLTNIVSNKIQNGYSFFSYILRSYNTGEITSNSTLLINVEDKKDDEIKGILDQIIPFAQKNLNWYIFSKKIAVLISSESKLNPLLNSFGINAFSREADIEDFIAIKNIH